jgi:hypothetical protein
MAASASARSAAAFSLSGKILVEDADERPIGEFSGGVFSWTRQLKDPAGVVIGTMDKKWAGLGKELFTSADNYHLEVAPESQAPARQGRPAPGGLLGLRYHFCRKLSLPEVVNK